MVERKFVLLVREYWRLCDCTEVVKEFFPFNQFRVLMLLINYIKKNSTKIKVSINYGGQENFFYWLNSYPIRLFLSIVHIFSIKGQLNQSVYAIYLFCIRKNERIKGVIVNMRSLTIRTERIIRSLSSDTVLNLKHTLVSFSYIIDIWFLF